MCQAWLTWLLNFVVKQGSEDRRHSPRSTQAEKYNRITPQKSGTPKFGTQSTPGNFTEKDTYPKISLREGM